MRRKRRGYDRGQRVSDLIQQALAQIVLHSVDDSRFRFVTITGVVMSKDLSYAKIYVSILQDDSEQIKQIVLSLNRHAKGLRYELAQAVKLRIAPELRFAYDESTAKGFKVSMLIEDAMKRIDDTEDEEDPKEENNKE